MRSEAPDGGLYMPSQIPKLPKAFFNNLADMSANEIAYVIAEILFGRDFPSIDLKRISDHVASFQMPLREYDDNIYMLELFHGPTQTVKDIGSMILAMLLSHINKSSTSNINVLLATSGNTGNAVANGMMGMPGINVVTFFPINQPDERILNSPMNGSNVHLVGIHGTIEDCRNIMNKVLTDPELSRDYILTSANSTNIGRTLAQTFIFFNGVAQLIKLKPELKNIVYSVPAGNCGTLLAGCIAKQMGLNISKFFAGCNASGSLHNFLHPESAVDAVTTSKSVTYAVDVRQPSNISRFLDLYGSVENISNDVESYMYDDQQIVDTLQNVAASGKPMLNPHTALAYRCMIDHKKSEQCGIVLATAHPDASSNNSDSENEHHVSKKRLDNMKHISVLPPTYPAVRKRLLQILK